MVVIPDFARVLLVLVLVARALAQTQQTDGAALCSFYTGLTANAARNSLRSWCVGSGQYSPCGAWGISTWTGVGCGTVGGVSRVVSLTLKRLGLAGSIPSTVGNLGALTQLDLSWNSFSSSLPSQLGQLAAHAARPGSPRPRTRIQPAHCRCP